MIEEQLRAELAAHMAGATPVTDWATQAVQNTRRRHRHQLVASVAAAVGAAVIVGGVVTLPGHHERAELKPAASPSPVASPSRADYPTAFAAPDGAWSISFRTTRDLVCLDVTRAGVQQLFTACAPDNPSYASLHHIPVTRDGKPAILEFGLVPAGTRSVALVSDTGVGTVATLTPQPIHGALPMLWFEEDTQESVSALAQLANGTTIDLSTAERKTCSVLTAEVPAIEPCPSSATAIYPTTPEAPVQSGYGQDETFCSAQGDLHYVVRHGLATLTSTLTGLPTNTLLGFNWINNTIRGYNIAAGQTTTDGMFDAKTLNMVRPGEVRGIAMQVTNGDAVILRLDAC